MQSWTARHFLIPPEPQLSTRQLMLQSLRTSPGPAPKEPGLATCPCCPASRQQWGKWEGAFIRASKLGTQMERLQACLPGHRSFEVYRKGHGARAMIHAAVGGGDPVQSGVRLAAASGLVFRGSQAHSDGLRAISHQETTACAGWGWGRLRGPAVLESECLCVCGFGTVVGDSQASLQVFGTGYCKNWQLSIPVNPASALKEVRWGGYVWD